MKKNTLISRIVAVVLVLATTGAVLTLGMSIGHSQVESAPADYGYVVATDAEPTSTAWSPQRKLAATSDGNLHVVYHREDGSGILQIYHAESSDGGVTWTEEQVTFASRDQNFPALAVDSADSLHLVWQDGRHYQPGVVPNTYYQKKTTSWQPAEFVASYATNPSIAIDTNDDIHVVYGGYAYAPGYWGGGNGIRWRMKTSAGWQTEQSISSYKSWQRHPAIAVDGNNNVHVVWSHSPTQYYDVHYRERTSTGWGPETEINTEKGGGGLPSIAIDSSNYLHVVWHWEQSGGGNYSIKYREYTTSWQPVEDVVGITTYAQLYPSIALDGKDSIHIVWSGQHSGSPTYPQIRYREHTASWQPIENLTSSSSHNQTSPNLMWAFYPIVGGIKTSQPEDGYAFIWMDDTTARYWSTPLQSECIDTFTDTGTACLTVSNGTIENLQAVPVPAPPPHGVKLPHGMFTFEITGLTPGQSVTFTAEFPDPIPTHWVWWKYHNETWSQVPITRTTNPRIITFTLTDGVYPGDEDDIPGQITDQGGPGDPGTVGWETYPVSRTRVMLPWIVLLTAMIVGASLFMLRCRHS